MSAVKFPATEGAVASSNKGCHEPSNGGTDDDDENGEGVPGSEEGLDADGEHSEKEGNEGFFCRVGIAVFLLD